MTPVMARRRAPWHAWTPACRGHFAPGLVLTDVHSVRSVNMNWARYLLIAVLLVLAAPAHADQYAYVTVGQATRAMDAIATSPVVQSFCAPCDEARSRPIQVRSIEIGRIWEGGSAVPYESGGRSFWEVIVNGEGVDLAYLYIRRGDRWENLALALDLDVVKVPRYLAPAQLGR